MGQEEWALGQEEVANWIWEMGQEGKERMVEIVAGAAEEWKWGNNMKHMRSHSATAAGMGEK